MSAEGRAVVDASLVIDFVLGTEGAASIGERIDGVELWVPAHFDAEVLSAFGRMERAGALSAEEADLRLRAALAVPLHRELLAELAWGPGHGTPRSAWPMPSTWSWPRASGRRF